MFFIEISGTLKATQISTKIPLVFLGPGSGLCRYKPQILSALIIDECTEKSTGVFEPLHSLEWQLPLLSVPVVQAFRADLHISRGCLWQQ